MCREKNMHSRFLLFVPSKQVDESVLFFEILSYGLPETHSQFTPENQWLEDEMSFYGMAGMADFQGLLDLLVSGCLPKEFWLLSLNSGDFTTGGSEIR